MGEKKGTKVTTAKKAKVVVPTRYFSFFDHPAVKDLESEALVVKQEVPFIPQDKKGAPLDEGDVTLEIYEIRDAKTERKPFLVCRVKGKVKKDEGYNFVVDSVEQDPKAVPQANRPKNGRKKDLFLPARLKVLGTDGKERGKTALEIVLPPIEYDETLELQLGASIPNSVVGQAKVTWGTWDAMMKRPVVDLIAGVAHGAPHVGNLEKVVVHCMCAINGLEDEDKPSDSYRVDLNRKILVDLGFSAHFIIDRDGGVHQLVDIHNVAHHAGGANSRSIGIELLGFFDGVREAVEKRATKERDALEKQTKKLGEKKTAADAVLAERRAKKAGGATTVKIGKKSVPIDDAIREAEADVEKIDKAIADLAPSAWLKDFDAFTAAKDAGDPLVYLYEKAQYEALGELIEALGWRYGYEAVVSHHQISPDRKTDPGKLFDWALLTPYLLPGTLAGDEKGSGGKYTVKL